MSANRDRLSYRVFRSRATLGHTGQADDVAGIACGHIRQAGDVAGGSAPGGT